MERIIASFALPGNPVVPDFDGLAELYFAKVEDIRAMFAGPVPAMMRKDEENFVQMNAPAVRLVAKEYVIRKKGSVEGFTCPGRFIGITSPHLGATARIRALSPCSATQTARPQRRSRS